jgi:hypothetical protein
MYARIEAGTDVAMLGAWDHGRMDPSLAEPSQKLTVHALEHDAEEGHLFLIHTGGDGSAPIDVYIDADAPANVRKKAKSKDGGNREYLIHIPTGRLVVGGVEDYRHPNPRTTTHDSILSIPAGDYRLRCYIGNHADSGPVTTIQDVEEKVLTPEEREFYRAGRRKAAIASCLGYVSLLLFPALALPYGWKIALGITFAVGGALFYVLDLWAKRHGSADPRWQRLNKMVERAWLGSHSASFILELHRLDKPTNGAVLKGGSIRVA